MRKTILHLFALLLLLPAITFSCKKSVNGVILTPTVLNLVIGEEALLTATIVPENATDKSVTWESSDTNVATVDNGKVTAIAKGKATITVRTNDGNHIAKCFVAIESVTGVSLSRNILRLALGVTVTLTATVIPENATNKTLFWESSNTDVATVDNGKVTAKAEGEAIATVTTKDGNYTAKCRVIAPLGEPEMVWVEKGTFTMGCTDDECFNSELPAHQVTLTRSFSITKYQVTQKLWTDVMVGNPSYFKGNDIPVHQISWINVQEFIKKLNEVSGKKYRLPTEAEWEYAARGGNQSKGYKYSGSNNLDEVAWYKDNSNTTIHSVGLKKPNELGVYDMSGNVWEWCYDGDRFYTNEPQTNPVGPTSSTEVRVLRGGDASGISRYNRVSTRNKLNYEECGYAPYFNLIVGFRLVLSQ